MKASLLFHLAWWSTIALASISIIVVCFVCSYWIYFYISRNFTFKNANLWTHGVKQVNETDQSCRWDYKWHQSFPINKQGTWSWKPLAQCTGSKSINRLLILKSMPIGIRLCPQTFSYFCNSIQYWTPLILLQNWRSRLVENHQDCWSVSSFSFGALEVCWLVMTKQPLHVSTNSKWSERKAWNWSTILMIFN